MIVNYRKCYFIHKIALNSYVINYKDCRAEYFNDISLQAAKADIEQQTGVKFITSENDLIKRKRSERMAGIKKIEHYLILEK